MLVRYKSFVINALISTAILLLGLTLYHTYFLSATKIIEKSPTPSYAEVSLNQPINRWREFNRYNAVTPNFNKAAVNTTESVVFINAYEKIGSSLFKNEVKREKGSGVIISDDGDIITNYHVIADADFIEVTLADKREFVAQVIGTDQVSDIALLKIEAESLSHLLFTNSDSLKVGDWVLAVGNPFGLQSTVTAGIVSAKARDIDILDKNDIGSYIQTDAVLNPGSSGGALVNSQGQLMGISTAILSSTGNYQGLSFAIPSNVARKVVVDIKEFGSVQRGKIGAGIRDVDDEMAKKMGLPAVAGVYINRINLNSAASDAGLRKGDVIINISGNEVNAVSSFYESINKYRPGDDITISYYRNGKLRSCSLQLRNLLNTTDFVSVRKDKILRDLGIEIRDLNSIEKERVKSNGVMIISVSNGSLMSKTNMEPGYIVESFNDIPVSNSQEFISLIKNTGDSVILRGFYERYPGQYPYSFTLGDIKNN